MIGTIGSTSDFTSELLAFPVGDHDDMVHRDTLAYAALEAERFESAADRIRGAYQDQV